MMVLKKKTIIIVTLVVLLVVAGYISTKYGKPIKVENLQDDTTQAEEVNQTESPTASSQVAAGYFIDEKIGRENQRTINKQEYTDIINNKNASKEAKADAEKKLLTLVGNSEKEMVIESLIKTKGFEDAIVFLSDNSANVTVKSGNINAEQVSVIKNIVCRESGISATKVMVQSRE